MQKIERLIEFFSRKSYPSEYARAKAAGVCVMCGKPVPDFRDAAAQIEYNISGLCQKCQEEYLKKRG